METVAINIAMLRNPALMKENTIQGTNLARLVQIDGRSTEFELSFNFTTQEYQGRDNPNVVQRKDTQT